MGEIQLERHIAAARKDLLHFVEGQLDKEVYKHIGEKPAEWGDELNIISEMLTGEDLVALIGLNNPPVDDPEFRALGGDFFLYRGRRLRERGLWKKRTVAGLTDSEWTQYQIGGKAIVHVNRRFSDIPIETFLPENFEQIGEEVEKEKGVKRPIWRFALQTNKGPMSIYAKGADMSYGFYYSYAKPNFRLTSLASVQKTTSKSEMERTLEFSGLGIHVPEVIAYYEAPVEEFLFLSEVQGKFPNAFFDTHRREIIQQDAEMLAKLCLAGYRKQGFTDFDDKIFDGRNLYLIDVDECCDLYFGLAPDYRRILLNPRESKLRAFRKMQRGIFRGELKDALSEYRKSLAPTIQDMEHYIRVFYKILGWKEPSKKQLLRLTKFPANYMTQDQYMAIMNDTG